MTSTLDDLLDGMYGKTAAFWGPSTPQAPREVDPALQQRFNTFADVMRNQGVLAGTSHQRITIPKSKLTEQDVHSLGFEPVTIAIPEAGQDRFQSFRHPDNNFHIHSHGDRWTMHEDRHAAATMLMRRQGALKSFVAGMPHVFTEGVPGLANYVKGQLYGRKSTALNVDQELSPEAHQMIYGMPDSTSLAKAAHETRLKKKQRGWYTDPDPGFHDLKGKFEDAAKQSTGREVKLAAEEVAAIRDVLAKFGFLRRKDGDDDPVGVLASVLRNHDFGFGLPSRDKAARRPVGSNPREGSSQFSNPSPIESGDAAGRNMSFSTGMGNQGV